MTDDRRPMEISPGPRLDAAFDRHPDKQASTGRRPGDVMLPRAYPAEILPDGTGFLGQFLDVPEAGRVSGTDPAAVLAQLPRALLTGLRQVVRENRALPAPSATQHRPLIEIPVEALPRLLLHQRMLAAGLDDATVEQRLGKVPGWSVAELRDPLAPAERQEPGPWDLDLVMAALWVVAGGDRTEAFGATGEKDRDDLGWSRRQAALLALTLAGVAAPGLEVANVVSEVDGVGKSMLNAVIDNLERGIQLLMESLAVEAGLGPAGEAAVTLLLRRAAEAFRGAGKYLSSGNRPFIGLGEIWDEARELTEARLQVVGLGIDAVPQRCPIDLDLLLRRFSDTDIRPPRLRLLFGEDVPRSACASGE